MVKNSDTAKRRNIYLLTNKGIGQYNRRSEELKKKGIDLAECADYLNEMNMENMCKLSHEEFINLGCLMVTRIPILKNELPPNIPLVHHKIDGVLYIKQEVRNRLMMKATESDIREWHSRAADVCIDYDKPLEEKVYHLTRSGRIREASRLVKSERYRIIDTAEEELTELVCEIAKTTEDADMLMIATRVLIENGNLDTAMDLATKIYFEDNKLGGSLISEILLKKDRKIEALEMAIDSYDGGHMTGLVLGMCLLENGHPEVAKKCLKHARESMVDSKCLFLMDTLLRYEAMAELDLDNPRGYSRLMTTAISLSRSPRRKADMVALSEHIGSEHGVLLEGVEV